MFNLKTNTRHLLLQTITELPGKLHYSLRFPAESRTAITWFEAHLYTWFTNLLFPSFLTPGPRNHDIDNGGIAPGYYQEGFLAVQQAIAMAFLKSFNIENVPDVVLQVPRFTIIQNVLRLNVFYSIFV